MTRPASSPLLALVALTLALAAGARADGTGNGRNTGFALQDPALHALWQEGVALEQQEALAESSRRYEAVAAALPGSAFVRWRLARNYWRLAERLPAEARDERMRGFVQAERWADRALDLDDRCGECMLWKLAALGRQATTGGVVRAARTAPRIARLIERGIALRPTHRDGPRNVTLANLYYAGSAFYRVVPDWFWLKLVIGVRGDKQRALDYIQRAIAITEDRVDYQVELGAVLLCIGSEKDEPARIEEGRRVLRSALELANLQSTDDVDREHAGVLMAEPERACGYSRDGWIDLDEEAMTH